MVTSDDEENQEVEVWGGGGDSHKIDAINKNRLLASPIGQLSAVIVTLILITSVTAFAGIGPAASIVDSDGDGVYNWDDNCPNAVNSEQNNYDNDAYGDVCDSDDDNDQVSDDEDDLPMNPTESIDSDGDGTGDNADLDDDNDLVLDVNDAFPYDSSETVDTDGDGIGNNADTDDDDDGVKDTSDAFSLNPDEHTDTDGDGTGDNADSDIDGDGYLNWDDWFEYDNTEWSDYDNDGAGDNADSDDDNDGIMDYVDSCRESSSWIEKRDYDDDGCYDGEDYDDDDDGLYDSYDNCPQGWISWTQTSTTDYDDDGCHDSFEDDDDDNDGLLDMNDDCPKSMASGMAYTNWDSSDWKLDFDGDGCRDIFEDDDDDNDGIPNGMDWYGFGDGHVTVAITHWMADLNDCDYDSDCGSPDVYFIIRIDADCDLNYEITYNQKEDDNTYYQNKREIGDGSYNLKYLTFDVPEGYDEICYNIKVMDEDGWAGDVYLDYTTEGFGSYRMTRSITDWTDRTDIYSTIGAGENMQCSITINILSHDENGIHWDRYE